MNEPTQTAWRKFFKSAIKSQDEQEKEIAALTADRDLWRDRCERLIGLTEEAFINTLCSHHLLFTMQKPMEVDWSLADRSCAKCDFSLKLWREIRPKAQKEIDDDANER